MKDMPEKLPTLSMLTKNFYAFEERINAELDKMLNGDESL